MNDTQYDYQEYWKTVCESIRKSSQDNDYELWFQRITYLGSEKNKVILAVPSQFLCDHVTKQYKDEILSILRSQSGEDIAVDFVIRKDAPTPKGNELSTKSKVDAPVVTSEEQSASARKTANINGDYLFTNFVIGDNCTFAYNASLAIAKNPGTSYNPCLIYGGVGLGKTHLINAIGNYILDTQKDLKVLYITAEAFVNEFIESISDVNKAKKFKNKFRKVDVLLMDDIQFIQNKTQSQEELFHTFNELYESKHQIVFTCDRPINELRGVMDRLTNRFERGLNVDLQPPAYETRIAIIKNKCKMQGKSISDDIINYIAQNVRSNVRDLEASMTKLVSYSELLGQELTLDKAKELLSVMPFFQPESKEQGINISSIIKTVCNYFNVSSADVKSKKKNKSLVQPRQISMYLAKQLTDYSLTEIGSEFGNRDHTTVMHACDRINSMASVNPEFKAIIEKLKKEVCGG